MMNNNLTVQNIEGQLVVSSRQVAEDFGKEHKNVLKRIGELVVEINLAQKVAQYFILDEYRDASGKMNKEYLLTRDGFSLVVMGFTGAKALQWKLKYIEAFNKMEEVLKVQQLAQPQLPTNYKEALLMLVQAEEEKEALQLENQQVKQIAEEHVEKAQAYETVFEITGGYSVEAVAQGFGIKGLGRNKMFQYLRTINWLTMKNKPTQYSINQGYLISKSYSFFNGTYEQNAIKVLITEKGVRTLYKRLFKELEGRELKTVDMILLDLNQN